MITPSFSLTATERVLPKLALDFTTGVLDPRITFSRPTTATYYDGKTVVKAEENLLRYSQEFDNSAWVKLGATITANATTAPDGTSTASTLVESATTVVHRTGYNSAASSTTGVYTFSFYAKANTRSRTIIAISDSVASANVCYACFNLSTGVFDVAAASLGSGWSTPTTASLALSNGWYRITISATRTTSGSVAGDIQLDAGTSGAINNVYAGNGTSGIYIWGAQLEQRSTVTAYTPTTTAPITNYIPALQTAAAGVPRFDHDPVTGESKGLLIEEQRTNLLTYSEQFDNAVWNAANSTVFSNSVISPDGNLTADKLNLTAVGSNSYSLLYRNSVSLSGTYSDSLWIKGELGTEIVYLFYVVDGVYKNLRCVLTTSWQRFSFSFVGGTVSYWHLGVDTRTGSGQETRPAQTIYIWGAQLEAGGFPTSYIPTTSAALTRNADVATMTGTNFSDWWTATTGSVNVSATQKSIGGTAPLVQFDDNTADNIISLRGNAANPELYIKATTDQAQIDAGTIVANTAYKLAGAWNTDNCAAAQNGNAAVTDTSATIPTVTQARIGSNGTNYANAWLQKINYWPQRVTNNETQAFSK